MIQYCTPLEQIIDQPLPPPGNRSLSLSVAYHTVPGSYQAAVKDLREWKLYLSLPLLQYGTAIMIPTLRNALRNRPSGFNGSTQYRPEL